MVHLASQSYGKDLVRILRLHRDQSSGKHSIVEYNVRCLLSGAQLLTSYTEGDNSLVVATDSIKNTLNILAKRLPPADVLCPERFCLRVAEHFIGKYSHVEKVYVDLEMLKWSRISLKEGKSKGPHKHSFVRDGEDKRIVHLVAVRQGKDAVIEELQGGLKDLLVLKTTASEFNGFWRDEYTTLKEVTDRIFSTAIDCKYSLSLPAKPITHLLSSASTPSFCNLYDTVREHTLRVFADTHSASVQATLYTMCKDILEDTKNPACRFVEDVEYALPNKHYIPIDVGFIGLKNLANDDAEVFLPASHPSGLIQAKVSRHAAKL